jgi:hypothetical protein
LSLRFAAALAAVGLLASGMVFAEGAKPNDAQIAHIAYAAGQLDIAANRPSRKVRIRPEGKVIPLIHHRFRVSCLIQP